MAVEEIAFRARGAAAALFRCNAPEVLIEGPAGTGKTRVVGEKLNWLCETYPGIRVVMTRYTRVSMTESVLVTWEDKVLWPGHPAISGNASRANRKSYEYPNGSVVVVKGLDDPESLYSTEWDVVYVAEATEIDEDAWEKFDRALRNNKIPMGEDGAPLRAGQKQAIDKKGMPRFWTQKICDCNPAYPGHWLNHRADKCPDTIRLADTDAQYKRLQEYNRKPLPPLQAGREGGLGGLMKRLLSKHRDNPTCTEDYLNRLRSMSGHRRSRLYEGRWVAAEGTVYGAEWSDTRHVCDPFEIPDYWPWLVGWDPGYDHPTAILWLTVGDSGTIYIADEIYMGGKGVSAHCQNIHARNSGRTVHRYWADPHYAFSSTAGAPDSIAIQAKKFGITLAPWPACANFTQEEAQVDEVRELLMQDRLKVFRTCTNTINEFTSWRYKRTAKGETPDGRDAFEDRNNHAMDVVKGVIATHPTHEVRTIEVLTGGASSSAIAVVGRGGGGKLDQYGQPVKSRRAA